MDDDPLRRLGSARLKLRRRLAHVDDELITAAAMTFGARLEALERRLDLIAAARNGSLGAAVHEPLGLLVPQCDQDDRRDGEPSPEAMSTLMEAVQTLRSCITRELDAIATRIRGMGPAPSRTAGAATEDELAWESIVFGEELAAELTVAPDREALLADLHHGDPAAGSLVGQLLVFHSADDAQKPQLLKELGEAYYRWQPQTPGLERPLETVLSTWLEKACGVAGTRRKILLVRLGSRFNAAYHRSANRGGEIIEVLGWVILREDGSVYQKASVEVR